MARGSALVDDVREIARERPRAKAEGGDVIRVRFAGGTAARLDPANARDRTWAEVLESLRESQQPAYVEVDPETQFITSLLLPGAFLVTAIREAPQEGGLEVDLEISQARHYLRREHPRFDEMRKTLERAHRDKSTVLVTESLDRSAIVDARPANPTKPKAAARPKRRK